MKTHNTLLCILVSCFFSWTSVSQISGNSIQEAAPRQKVEMVTNYGMITLELYNETPFHRDNFINLVKNKAYNDLLFHRVIENFMIQGGDPESKNASAGNDLGEGDLAYTVPPEFNPHLFHKKGALAAARTDNSERASSAMQFYIVQGKVFNDSLLNTAETRINKMLARHYLRKEPEHLSLFNDLESAIEKKDEKLYVKLTDSIDGLVASYTNFDTYTIPETHRKVYKEIGGTPHLDQNYTVFGQVVDGLEVIDLIAAVPTLQSDRPIQDVKIIAVRFIE